VKRAAVITSAVLAATCACSHSATAHHLTSAAVTAPPARYLGYAGPDLARFEAATGTRPDMITDYLQPGDPFTPPPAGVTPLVSLATTRPPGQVLAGVQDRALTVIGRQIAAYGKPVVVSIDPEGNGPWYSYGTRQATAAEYIAVYRHVEVVLKRAGARDVTWAWVISNSPPITHPSLLRSLYPGDAWTGIVGVDGYFIGSEDSWQQVFARVFAEVRAFSSRPFLITETSVQPGPDAAQWVRELFAGAEGTPGLLGFVWFDYDKAAQFRDDWRLEDDPAALAVYRAAVGHYR
jgi:hypothetical protein